MGGRTDSRETAAELRSRGVEALQWAFEIADLWSNVLGFTDYVKQPSRARG
jgi:hypothetical protein